MEIESKHITLGKFLEYFKPELDNTVNSKVVLPNGEFVMIATLLKILWNLEVKR